MRQPSRVLAGCSASLVVRGIIVALIAATVAFVAPATAAHADSGDVELSLDGVHYSSMLSNGVFAGVGRLVPGDSVTRTLWVKNPRSTDGELRIIRIMTGSGSTPLSDALTLTTGAASSRSAAIAPSATLARCSTVTALPLSAGEEIAIPLTLSLADLSHRVAQDESTTFSLAAVLTDVGDAAPEPSECATSGTAIPVTTPVADPPVSAAKPAVSAIAGLLAFTGGALPYSSIMLGSLLLGFGLFIIVAARRRKERRET